MAGSFERVNYSLRPNKSIERRLVFEFLSAIRRSLGLSGYAYVGMGSIWFVDFILAHRLLGIKAMVSIEKSPRGAARARANLPYSCIEVIEGETTCVLPDLDWSQPVVCWMDYDSGWEGPALGDLRYLSQKVESGSIVIVTVNGSPGALKNRRNPQTKEPIDPADVLRGYAGDLVPAELPVSVFDNNRHPAFVARLFHDHIRHCLFAAGRSETYRPVFNFMHQDNAPMVTVGGMIGAENVISELEGCIAELCPSLPHIASEELQTIEVPLLTPREKLVLDSMLPRMTLDELKEHFKDQFTPQAMESYFSFYRYFPTFAELLI